MTLLSLFQEDPPPTDAELIETCGENPRLACRKVLEWTDNDALAGIANWLVDRPLRVVIIALVAWLINRLARRAIGRFVTEVTDEDAKKVLSSLKRRAPGGALLDTGRSPSLRARARAETITLVLKSIATAIIWTIAAVMILAEIGINVGPLIAGAGIAGVALGFGAQSLVRDFLSGMFMLVEDQFGVGDFVDVGVPIGEVEAVSLRTTRIRDLEGTVWHVPNGEIHRVGNMSQQWARALIDVSVAYGTDLALAESTIEQVADEMYRDEEWKYVLLEPPEVWGVQELGADGIAIRVVIKTKPNEQWRVTRQLRRRLKDTFDEVGIEIPFPQRTMWIRRDEGSSRDHPMEFDDEETTDGG